jgi:hypothetical protein
MAIGWKVGVGVGAGAAVDVSVGVAEGSIVGNVIVVEAEGRTTGCEISPGAELQAVIRRISGNKNRAAVANGFWDLIMYFR